MDIRANLSEPITLEPLQRCQVPTGLYIALPKGFEAQVRPRSGLAIKKGITVLNSPGTKEAGAGVSLQILPTVFPACMNFPCPSCPCQRAGRDVYKRQHS